MHLLDRLRGRLTRSRDFLAGSRSRCRKDGPPSVAALNLSLFATSLLAMQAFEGVVAGTAVAVIRHSRNISCSLLTCS
jgi:hypothetical protein